jgi:hypothetical protein
MPPVWKGEQLLQARLFSSVNLFLPTPFLRGFPSWRVFRFVRVSGKGVI